METIKIQYHTDKIDKLEYIDGKSDWIDLRAAEEVEFKAGEFKLVNLGVSMRLPEGYEAHIAPRSSTFKNYVLISILTKPLNKYRYLLFQRFIFANL